MKCFERLKKSNFMSNITSELEEATCIITEYYNIMVADDIMHSFNKDRAKEVYYMICNEIGFFSSLYSMGSYTTKVYYTQSDRYIFICTHNKKDLTREIHYNCLVNGDVPLYTNKHIIKGKTVHTALIDTWFTIVPPTTN